MPRADAAAAEAGCPDNVAGNLFDVPLLPQQQLVLELLRMSGEIAVLESAEGTILWRTLQECRQAHWIIQKEVSPGVFSVSLTATGRRALETSARPAS
jgi:hypothetical protein